jgi:TRAP-type transport system periplasmic protein
MIPDVGRRDFAALIAGWLLRDRSVAQAATVWHLATGYRADSFHAMNIRKLLDEVNETTRGGLQIVLHADGSLVKLGDIPAAVKAGSIAAGECIMSGLIGEIPVAGADSVPFIVSSYADSRRLWHWQRPLIERHFAERGLHVLYAVPWPPQGLYTKRPVSGLADLKGSLMRSYGATTQRIAQLLGAKSVDVALPQVGQAFADGRIDTMITSAVSGVDNQVWKYIGYYYEIDAWFPKNIVFANAAAVKALPAAEREALTRASVVAEVRGWAASNAAAVGSLSALRANGVKVERPSGDFASAFKRMGERQSIEWIRQVGLEANEIFIPYFTRQ